MPNDLKKTALAELEKKYRITKKYEDWVHAFLNKGSETYGNATRSALLAYNLDPETQYSTAARIGHDNTDKHKDISRLYAESQGVTLGTLLSVQMRNALNENKSNQKAWFDDLKVDLGYREPPGAKVVINNTQNMQNVDINAPEAKDFNAKFKDFLYQEND